MILTVVISAILLASPVLGDMCDTSVDDAFLNCTSDSSFDDENLPQSVEDFKKFCDETKKSAMCIKEYAIECMPKETRHVTGIVTSGMAFLMKSTICGSDAEKKEFQSHMPCLNATKPLVATCKKDFFKALKVEGLINEEKKLTYACCNYHKMRKCLKKSIKEAGNDKCSPESYMYMEKLSNKLKSMTIDILCGSELGEDSEECQNFPGYTEVTYEKPKLKKLAAMKLFIKAFSD